MNILITGGTGFLGSNLVVDMLAKGYSVSLLLRSSLNLKRINNIKQLCHLEYYESETDIIKFIKKVGPDVIIHTACSYGRNGESELKIIDANLKLGLALIEGCIEIGKPCSFINIGTILDRYNSPYALSKNQFSEWGKYMSGISNQFVFINVLLHHMYGPGDDISKFPTYILHACYNNKNFIKLTNGDQCLDFIYIDDVVYAISTIIDSIKKFSRFIDIEIGSGIASSVKTFVEMIHALTLSKTKLLFGALPYRKKELMYSQANISMLSLMEWKPKYDLKAGLKKTIKLELKKFK